MARPRKESHPFSIKMDSEVYAKLEVYCQQSGQSKAVAIERAVQMFINDYDEKMRVLRCSANLGNGKTNE